MSLKSKHADVLNTCKEREILQKQKEIFRLSMPQGSTPHPHPVSISREGEVDVYKYHFYFKGKSYWSYSGLLIVKAGQRQQLE